MDKDKIEEGMRIIMKEGLKLDMNNQHFKDTPTRVACMYKEIFSGLYAEEPKIKVFDNIEGYDQMIGEPNIPFMSVCAHHFLPFYGRVAVAYIPKVNGKIVGLSKLARIVDFFSNRPTIQEKITQEVADYIMNKIHPLGCGVRMIATHQCMGCRGVKKLDAIAVTTAIKGIFLEKEKVKEEFIHLAEVRK